MQNGETVKGNKLLSNYKKFTTITDLRTITTP